MKTNKTAIIAGASGQIGNYLLHDLLESKQYEKVIALVRNPLGISHPKLQEIKVDFTNPDTLKIKADDVFCCLGTTIKTANTKENFKAVDYGYPMALAQATLASGASRFFVVSSAGTSLDSSIFYAKVKAEMERDLQKIGFNALYIFKPSMLLGPRKEFRFGELMGKFFMQILAPLIPKKYKGVQASKVAESMLHCANTSPEGVHFIDNEQILSCPSFK